MMFFGASLVAVLPAISGALSAVSSVVGVLTGGSDAPSVPAAPAAEATVDTLAADQRDALRRQKAATNVDNPVASNVTKKTLLGQ